MTKKHTSLHQKILLALFCNLAIFIFVANAAAQTANFTAQSYPLLGNTHVTADFNGDGKLDLAGSSAKSADVMLGNGDGTFGAKISYPVADWTQDIAVGDFNSDGRADLIVTINTPQIGLSLLIGNGDGTFRAPVNFPNSSGSDSPSVIAADLNNDGRLDAAIMHTLNCYNAPCVAAATVTVMLGNGDGTFQTVREIPAGQNMHRMTAGDFNRDGIKDLAIGAENTQLYILLGVGDGTFNRLPAMSIIPGGDLFSACNDVDVADFNRDTVEDLVVALGNGNGNAILLGNGDGTFRNVFRITERAVQAPFNLAAADYNGDGLQDIARAMGYGNLGLMEIANGNGDGTFQAPIRYLVPTAVTSEGGIFITSSDFNGDDKSDIALEVGGAGNSLKVLTNLTGTQPSPVPLTVSSLTLNPSTVTGGNSVTGTVTLSARAQTATVVRLASGSAAASVPASVTIASGSSTASFTISTARVSALAVATITATLNSASRSANLTINPVAAPSTDTISISRAEYDSGKRTLRVEASSSRSTATLQVFVTSTNQLIGTLTNSGGNYSGQFNLTANPQNITVRSNGGGQASRAVTAK